MAALALLFRVLLVNLPGLGRDEAAYLGWAFHPEPAYAPLLQLLLRLGEATGLPLPWAARLPGLLVGLLALIALGRFLRDREEPHWALALAAVALSPWATYVGSIVHPDALFMLAVICFALADRRRHLVGLAGAALLAVAAKPSGALLLPIAAVSILRSRDRPAQIGAGLLVLGGASILAWLSPTMLTGLSKFARTSSDLNAGQRLVAGVVSTVALGGTVLPLAGLIGMWRSRAWSATRLAGLAYVIAFLGAALVTGQVKGNWALPGLLLLWPSGGLGWSRRWLLPATTITALGSSVMVAAMVQPAWVARLEASQPGLARLYVHHAGDREAQVSSTRTWSQRFTEYRSLDLTAQALRQGLGDRTPAWIVSDDYGLASQLAATLSRGRIPVVLPHDPIFARSVDRAEPMRPSDVILYMGVRTPPATLAREMNHPWMSALVDLPALAHPVTGEPILLASTGVALSP